MSLQPHKESIEGWAMCSCRSSVFVYSGTPSCTQTLSAH